MILRNFSDNFHLHFSKCLLDFNPKNERQEKNYFDFSNNIPISYGEMSIKGPHPYKLSVVG